ncbi:MAG TPA: ATP-dependent Clp protease proteolytic subunit, partial [Micromonosporaceae bacterium]|nr:ATP-dependent Clp protease proteolytic subunit [Micromonosporaceae bacterium]
MTELHIPPAIARGADQGGNIDDRVYDRLLKERIIFLGSEVTDQVANRICAQLLLLA